MAEQLGSLVEIPKEQWPSLLDFFQNDHNLTARVSIRNQIFQRQKMPDFPSRIFAIKDKLESGIIIKYGMSPTINEYSVYTTNVDNTEIVEALKNTNLIKSGEPFLFCSVMPTVQGPLKRVLSEMNVETNYDQTYLAHITKEKAIQLQTDSNVDVDLKILEPKYADEINSTWPHRYEGSEKYFHHMLSRGMGYGLLGKVENDLRGWVFISTRGDMHAIYIKEEFRRRKYAQHLIKCVCKVMLERETEIYGCIVVNNEPSKRLFSQLGFEFLAVLDWIYKFH